ncbi:LOW QUALITY PROTEIN: hypothetical protein Cgig2_001808 [Carnegiea gigantea]|uniref:Uncharacterized protein n=1 Tax=Carnegiea gigantea TaxID=171969 RepID=A0A9Q1GT58_9CARY|nr:LOW QUALITY PROTEIN: hypothetical protein Cgig2_001808 [Carnegiea gigantea]
MKHSTMLHPRKDLVYRLHPPGLEELDEWEHSVVGQFADTHHFSLEEVQEASQGFIAVCKKDHYFQFKCSDPQDRDALIQLESLAIRGGLLVLQQGPAEQPMSRWRFTDTTLWVQIHNVHPLYHNSTTAFGLAQLIGEPIDVGFHRGLELSKAFLQARGRADLTTPLTPSAYITDSNEVFWSPYENVFHLCKRCGKVDHRELTCTTPVPIAAMILDKKYATFELRQIPLVCSYRWHCFSNCIRALQNTPNYLTSTVDLLEPGSPDYGPVPVYGYG